MEQLLTTKLYTPQLRSNLVHRSNLINHLNGVLRHKLTLVSAPAGFGKSTLVNDWLAENEYTAAWLSLDQGDNDTARFWTYLIASIQTVHQDLGSEARQIISSPQLRSAEPVVISLLNEISQLDHDLILVLDDYQFINERGIHDSLSYLLEHQPPNLHIVLITRIDPPFSLARLRAHGRLIEIRAEDLQFSSGEAAILFNEVMSLNLDPLQVEAMNLRTEGWAVGLQLAALTLKGQSSYETFIEGFTGSHQFILDYLTEEVLCNLPEAQRMFLLRTSIMEKFCGELCDVVTGDISSHKLLPDIRSGNLFLISLDAKGSWFRYHHLFADVLRTLLERDYPNEIEALHLKAAAWFDDMGYADEAIDHALLSGDMAQTRILILKHWTPALQRGEITTVLRWLDALPKNRNGSDPSVSLARCWALFLSWQNSAIEPYLEQASTAYERLVQKGSLIGAEQVLVAAQLAMMRSVLARDRGEHAESVSYAEEATRLVSQEMLEGIGTAWNMLAAARAGAGEFDGAIEAYERGVTLAYAEGNLVGAYGCTYGKTMYMLVKGHLTKAEELCRSTIDRAIREGHEDFPAAGWLHIAMARIKLELNRLDDAEVYLSDGLRIARRGGFNEAVRSGRYLRAHLAAARGDLGTATEIFQDIERIVNAMDEPYLTGELNWEWAKLCLTGGNLDAARERMHILEEKSTITQHANLLLWQRSLLPSVLCAEERYEESLIALDESIFHARAVNNNGELICLLALRAVALEALGDRSLARPALCEAISLSALEGYIWRLLNAGPELGPLLRDLRNGRDMPQTHYFYLDSLVDAYQAAYGESTRPKPGGLLDPLTLRELEIMRLICKGYSNPEIARELVVTINTIKKHTSNIYDKLGVHSRTQAIARAHELNLL